MAPQNGDLSPQIFFKKTQTILDFLLKKNAVTSHRHLKGKMKLVKVDFCPKHGGGLFWIRNQGKIKSCPFSGLSGLSLQL